MRIINSIKNISVGIVTSFLSMIISFVSRVIFLYFLDATYLGVSSLFSNILLIFSLVELGIGAALTQMLYKPMAEQNYEELSAVVRLLRRMLNLVGCLILCLTVIFTPILELFVNDIHAVPHMRLIFVLYGISTGVTYFLGYYRTIITADQKAYKLVKLDMIWTIIIFLSQSLVLFLFRNFIAYLIIKIVLSYVQNFTIMIYVRKQYPDIDYKSKLKLPKEVIYKFTKDISALSLYRISMIVMNAIDSILISKFISLKIGGYAANYTMIMQSVSSLVEAVFGPLLASVGNLCVTESVEKKRQVFRELTFLNFYMYGVASILMMILCKPFIEIFFGEEFVLGKLVTFFLSLNVFVSGITRTAALYRTAEGLFWYGKFRPLAQAVLNVICSICFLKMTNSLWAIYAGTVVSKLMTTVWYDAYIVLKYSLKEKPWKFYRKICCYFAVYLMVMFFSISVTDKIGLERWGALFGNAIIGFCVANISILFIYWRSEEMKYLRELAINILNRIKK